jgi:hypothetical protein
MLRALFVLGAVMPEAVLADQAGTSFCAQLSSESGQSCVPVERGAKAAWDQVDVALEFAKTKNAESYLASMRAQMQILDKIKARQAGGDR